MRTRSRHRQAVSAPAGSADLPAARLKREHGHTEAYCSPSWVESSGRNVRFQGDHNGYAESRLFDHCPSGGADRSGGNGPVSSVVAEAGGAITALDVAESHPDMLIVDVSCNTTDVEHSESITKAIAALEIQRPESVRPHLPAPPWRQDRSHPESPAQAPR